MRLSVIITAMTLCISSAYGVEKADVSVKTNVISDALLSPSAGVEISLAPKWSIDVSGSVNLWTLSHGRRWRHWLVQPEIRYWLCETYSGHFLALHAHGGQYNIHKVGADFSFLGTDFRKINEARYQGWFSGAGIGYGYSWILSRHFNIEAEIGIGWSYTKYDTYECGRCGRKTSSGDHNYFGITKGALNLVYVF